MTAITIDAPAGPMTAELTTPTGSGPWPAVVVIHDLRGITDDVAETTARFAAQGYLVLAPDLFSRGGAVRCITRVMSSMLSRSGRAVDDLHAARGYLQRRPDCNGSIGITGFCLGGGFALVMGAKGFDVAAPFYPTIPPIYEAVAEGSCPVVASYGSRDVWNPGNGPRLQRALDRRGIPNDVKVYPGVGHSFANNLPHQGLQRIIGFGRDEAATEDSYRRLFAFFSTHLDH